MSQSIDRLDQYRWLTRSYPGLQGLRIVPIGLFIMLVGLQRLELVPFLGPQGNCTVTLPLMLFCFGLWFWLGSYYSNRFGRVEPLVGWWGGLAGIALQLIALVGVIVLEMVLFRAGVNLPVSLMEMVVGALLVIAGFQTRRHYYTLFGVVVLLLSVLPGLTGRGIADRWLGSGGLAFIFLFGIAGVLIGLLDHFALLRAFRRSPEADHG